MQMSKELEQQIAEFQNLQNQLQIVITQKQQIKLQLDEIDIALDELGKASGAIFKVAGSILLASTKDDAQKDLTERKETLGVRTTVLTKQEEKLKNKLLELRDKIQKATGGAEGAG